MRARECGREPAFANGTAHALQQNFRHSFPGLHVLANEILPQRRSRGMFQQHEGFLHVISKTPADITGVS